MKIISVIVFALLIKLNAHPGIGIKEDSKGNIYFTDLKQVWKIDVNGVKSIVVPNVHTHELEIDRSDNLYGEHLWYNGEAKDTWGFYVWKLTPDGNIQKLIPDTEGFRADYSFVKDKAGNMFRVDRTTSCQRIEKGKNQKYTHYGSTCFHNVRFMAMSKKEELLVVDFQDVIKFDRNGTAKVIATQIADKSVINSSISNQNSVMGIWDDADNNIYVAVYRNRVIKKFDPQGNEQTIYKSVFPWSPSGGLISSCGDLWVLETSMLNTVRVVHVMDNGRLKAY